VAPGGEAVLVAVEGVRSPAVGISRREVHLCGASFARRHPTAEEIYVVLAGSGRVRLDDELVELTPLDAVRVSPGVTRCFEADSDGLEVLIFGPRVESDGEIIQHFWAGE